MQAKIEIAYRSPRQKECETLMIVAGKLRGLERHAFAEDQGDLASVHEFQRLQKIASSLVLNEETRKRNQKPLPKGVRICTRM